MANADGDARAPRVTRDVEVSAVGDLLQHPPRAIVAFVEGGAVDVLPARALCSADTCRFGVTADVAPDLDRREVVLVIDDGPYWFELRGISVRGVAEHSAPPDTGESRSLRWYTIRPRRVLAWDYGAIREA